MDNKYEQYKNNPECDPGRSCSAIPDTEFRGYKHSLSVMDARDLKLTTHVFTFADRLYTWMANAQLFNS
jgi:hypothetical protein